MLQRNGRPFNGTILSSVIGDFSRGRNLAHWVSDDGWAHVLTGDDNMRGFLVSGFRFPINGASSSALVRDKIQCSGVLARARIPHITHFELSYANELDMPLVLKPRSGSGGVGVRLVSDRNEMADIQSFDDGGWAISEYFAMLYELRIVILDDRPLAAYKKFALDRADFPLHNISNGARIVDVPLNELEQSDLAIAQLTRAACLLRVCSVDICVGAEGERRVMEVNDGIMLEGYGASQPATLERARQAYYRILSACAAEAIL